MSIVNGVSPGSNVGVDDARRGGTSKPPSPAWTLILGSIGAFIASLDIVVVATALPTLRTHLHASLGDLEWTINAYNLAFACLMLTGSALGDRFGRRRVYSLGLLLFGVASAGCALSTTGTELIIARVIEGVGAAAVMPLTLTLISHVFPPEKRAAAIGIWGGVTGLGVSVGPVVGGALISVSWQWIFWINVPIAVVVAALTMLKVQESHGSRPQVDLVGLILIAVGFFGLTWAAVRAPSIGWGSAEVVGGIVGGAVFVIVFVAWERRARHPMVPIQYFRLRGFAAPNGVIFFQFMSMIGTLFMLTQLFQVGMGYTALGAGVAMLAWMLTPLFVAPPAGKLAERFGTKPFMVLGEVMAIGGLIWLALVVHTGVSYGSLVPPLIFQGIGSAMVFPTAPAAVTMSVPLGDAGVASGVNSALRELGAVFGVAIVAAVFAHSGGGYATRALFIHGWKPATYVAAIMAGFGLISAIMAPGRAAVARVLAEHQSALATASEARESA
jgi:EmrB/QacA subfamily drug resistance transporter